MGGCLIDLGKTFAEKLINGAIQNSRYVFCFKYIVKEFEEEKGKLEVERRTMSEKFEVAKNNDKDIKSNARDWENQANMLIEEDTKTKKYRCFFGFFPDCIGRYKRGGELESKIKEIKGLIDNVKRFDNVELTRGLPGVERYSSQNYISFKSRELKYEELLDALNDDCYYTVGLHGMEGIGKTTLAKEIGKQLKTSNQFNRVIITTVSSKPNIKKIQDDIAGPLGLKFGDISESERHSTLWSRLTNGEKILVIFDDVRVELNFDDIGIPQSDNCKGCKVLITTSEKIECAKTIELELLSEEDAWIMFKMYAGLNNSSNESFTKKGREIANECKKLPVAIATIGRSLKDQQSEESWKYALTFLQQPLSMGDLDDKLVKIYQCLQVSYDYMKDKKAKGLFVLCSLLCSLSPEISVEMLTKLGIAVGLFGEDYVTYEDARNQAFVAKKKLIDSCLLLEKEKAEVQMHDLVYKVAQLIAKEEIQTVNLSNKIRKSSDDRDKNIKYLVCEGHLMNFFSSRYKGSKLEILIFNMSMRESVEIPTSFFEDIAGLRVLILFHDGFPGRRINLSLPKSIESLNNIRYLFFDRFDLGDISVLVSLQSLETLELICCEIDQLPDEIAQLEKLKLLMLNECTIRSNDPFKVIQDCSSLEELYFCDSFNASCEQINLSRALKRYHLTEGSSLMNDSLSKCVSLKDDYFSEATFMYVMKTTEFLRLENIEKVWKSLIPGILPIDHGMNDLIELHLQSYSHLQFLIDTEKIDCKDTKVFSKLVVLELAQMKNLKQLCNGTISSGSFNNLEELSIEYCQGLRSLFNCTLNLGNLKTVRLNSCSKLVSVFDLSTSQNLQLLEKLVIIDCKQLKNIFTYKRRKGNDNNKSFDSMFPNLKVVIIRKCHKLKFILPLVSTKDLLLLEVINVESCDKLEYIFDQQQDVELASLKELWLDDLPNFIGIFPDTSRGTTSIEIPAVSENQPQDCSISTVSNLNCVSRSTSHMMCNIKEIKLVKLPKIKSVFILSIAPIMLTLETLDSGGGNIVFPNLKVIEVYNCDKLECILVHNNVVTQLHLPALTELHLSQSSQFDIKSIGDFIVPNYLTISISHEISPAIKELSGNMNHFLALERLTVNNNSKVESIFCLNEVNEQQQMDLGLVKIDLDHLPMITSLFVGPKNHFALKNLTSIKIMQCEKLEIVFSTSIIRNLPHLYYLRIEQCKELKHIIEDDKKMSNFDSSKTCLPKLEMLVVVKCNKLKCVLPVSICNKLPELKTLIIKEANELEEVFGIEGDQKVAIRNLENVAFVNLPSLSNAQGIQFQAVPNCFVQNCQNVSLTSALSTNVNRIRRLGIGRGDLDYALENDFWKLFKPLQEESDNSVTEITSSEIGEDIGAEVEVPATSRHMLTSSQGIETRVEIGTTSTNVKAITPSGSLVSSECKTSSKCLKEKEDESIQEGSTSQTNDPPIQLVVDLKQKGIKLSCEDVDLGDILNTTQTNNQGNDNGNEIPNAQTIKKVAEWLEVQTALGDKLTSSQKLKNEQSMDQQCLMNLQHSPGEIDTLIRLSQKYKLEGSTSEKTAAANLPTISGTKNEPSIQLVAPKQKGIKKSVEEGTTSNYDKTITSSTHLEDGIGQIGKTSFSVATTETNDESEDLSSSLLITRELEQLISKKHLDYENLSLLTDFLVKHPSVCLNDTSLRDRYKGYAYNLLAELLKFLETHSVLDVLGSSHSEFVELILDARNSGFDKDWLDSVERRTLFPDIQLPKVALQKLLDSKQHVTKEVELLRMKIGILGQHVEDLKHQLTSSEAVLETIIQQEAALSAPIGY